MLVCPCVGFSSPEESTQPFANRVVMMAVRFRFTFPRFVFHTERVRDDTKKEILFHALNIIYRGKARAEPNLRGGVCQELFPL